MQRLLIILKDWGADQHIVTPIVVLSSSKAAFGLTINMNELRTEHFVTEVTTTLEGQELVYGRVKPFVKCTDQNLRLFCEEVVCKVGTRPLHLIQLCYAVETAFIVGRRTCCAVKT